MKNIYWKMDESGNVQPATMAEGMEYFGNASKKIIARDTINGVLISTVFLVIDHSFDESQPILFETMLFKSDGEGFDPDSNVQMRYVSIQDARAGHAKAIEFVQTYFPQAQIEREA